MTTVTLSADQESFAADAIARGRFRDVPDVVSAAIDLLRRTEAHGLTSKPPLTMPSPRVSGTAS
jgi:Arc/MetJ-type ribon-helix-helix transcriptional regulator